MRRRILTAIVGVVLLAVVILSVPLGLIIATRDLDDAVRELERVAERGAASLEPGPLAPGDSIDLPGHGSNIDIAVYDGMGSKIAGDGPTPAEPFVLESATRDHAVLGSERVLTYPIVADEERIGTIRVAEPADEANEAVRKSLWVLVAIDVGAVLIAGGVGAWVASRLSRPLRRIRDDAVRLGDGDFSIEPQRCGVPELDETAAALAETASRLDDVLARERAFSSDASHQLRTPVASMRLAVETELVAPRTDPTAALAEVLTDVDRLETTIDTLLAVARDRPRMREPLDPDDLAQSLRTRWATRVDAVGRRLSVDLVGHPLTHVNRGVLDQILDVLVSNALEHGRGSVHVTIADDGGVHLDVTVTDGGALDQNTDSVFVRGHSGAGGHGLGLALARSLAEAEGGRLMLVDSAPTTFRLLLPDLE